MHAGGIERQLDLLVNPGAQRRIDACHHGGLADPHVEQDLRNYVKNQAQGGKQPEQEVEHPVTKVKFNIPKATESADKTVSVGEEGETLRVIDMMADDIQSRPDWQSTWDILVNEVEAELDKQRNADTKKTIFRKLLEYGLNPPSGFLQEIQEEVGMSPSALCNLIGRNIQPVVEKVVKALKDNA